MLNKSLAIGIVFLFIVSSTIPMVIGYETKTVIEGESPTLNSNGPMDSAWPMFGHDVRHTGRSPFDIKGNTGMLKWKLWLGHNLMWSSPVIDKDGIIYVGIWPRNDSHDNFYAINSDGTIRWSYNIKEKITASPALADDGSIYVVNERGAFYAFDFDGSVKWMFQIPGNIGYIHSSPVIDNDGTIYFGACGYKYEVGSLYVLNPNGTEKWHYDVDGWAWPSPAIDDEGNVYIGSVFHFYSFSKDGTLNWKRKPGSGRDSSPAIGEDGTIYYGGEDGNFYALYPNGTLKWKIDCVIGYITSPAIGEDGTIYIGTSGKEVISIDPNGSINWRFQADGWVYGAPAVDKYGNVYVGAWERYFYFLHPNGTLKWSYKTGDDIQSSPAIGEDGTIYFGSDDGYLYALVVIEDQRPEKPIVTGPTSVKTRINYTYHAVTEDGDDDNVSYWFDWGDGSCGGWTDYAASGSTINISHVWKKSGTYEIGVRAKDIYGNLSIWSDPLEVKVIYGDLGKYLYVGGDGPGNYSKIQDAVDAAVWGDTVFVYRGTYYENVKLNKKVRLIGEDRDTTTVDGSMKRRVFKITADRVTVSGFTIQNSSGVDQAGIEIISNYNTISGNKIINNIGDGILLGSSTIHGSESCYNTISDNIISNNTQSGIDIFGDFSGEKGDNNIISGNLISNNSWGIVLGNICCTCGNLVYKNHIINNSYYGIIMVNSWLNRIIKNKLDNNGIGIHIITIGLAGNIIRENNFYGSNPFASCEFLMFPVPNVWINNYWGRPRFLAKLIPSTIYIMTDPFYGDGFELPWVVFDWAPARLPNLIPNIDFN